MNDRYILNDKGQPVIEPNLLKWAVWYETSKDRVVKQETLGAIVVSTVFLALAAYGGGPPILWETMVFGGVMDLEQDRCPGNREQAEAMHTAMVERVVKAQSQLEMRKTLTQPKHQ